MSLTVVFPDVDALLIGALADALPVGTWVGIVKPEVMTGRQVVIVRRDGGPQVGRVLMVATVSVRVFAPTDEAVADLAILAQSILFGLQEIDDSGVSAVEVLSGASPIIDDSLIPCRLFTAQVYVRGS